MGSITSSVGLITGINSADLIDKLIALQAGPRDKLASTNKTLLGKKTSVTQLETLLIGLQLTGSKLNASTLYNQRTVASSDKSVTAAISGSPAVGSYNVKTLQLAQAQQLTSSGIVSDSTALGAGTFTVRYGGFVDPAASFDVLNSGLGVKPGSIKITDRSGVSANIDLTTARNIDDVIKAINTNTVVHVTASVTGGSLKLTDNTGATTSNLKVEEVNNGTTAAGLGLSGINTNTTSATGSDLLKVFNNLSLSTLNSGRGVRLDDSLSDLKINLRDGTSLTADLHKIAVPGTILKGETAGLLSSNAKVSLTAVKNGGTYVGASLVFEQDNTIGKGEEGVSYDENSKTLRVRIRQGVTTGDDVVAAINRDDTVSKLFTAARGSGADGTGLVSLSDRVSLEAPKATATLNYPTYSPAKVVFTAVSGGADEDDVDIVLVNNGAITAGHETVAYDASNPADKKLIFQISSGNTTATDLVNALKNNATASQHFTAAVAAGTSGFARFTTDATATTTGGAPVEPVTGTTETTIGQVLSVINALNPSKLKAAISGDGKGLVFTDLSVDGGNAFSLEDLNGAHLAADLGLSAASGDTITSTGLLGGLKTVRVADLGGTAGLGTLGSVSLTNKSGITATANLSTAKTLEDVLSLLNTAGSGIGITATINGARSGILLTDSSGGNGNLIIDDGDVTLSATHLKIKATTTSTTVNSGNLQLRTVSEATTLASLNGGRGVSDGSFTVFDTNGNSASFTLKSGTVDNIGDVIHGINSLGLAITATINAAGDGIFLTDTAHGQSTLKVVEGNSTTARDLRLTNAATKQTVGLVDTQYLDASTTTTITLSATDTLQDFVTKLNNSGAGVAASVINDGTSIAPFRLSLASLQSGRVGQLLIDDSSYQFGLQETSAAQDALISVSGIGNAGGIYATSSNNSFGKVISGVNLTVSAVSDTPAVVSVTSVNSDLKANMIAIVDGFNKAISNIQEDTSYDATTNQAGILQGDGAMLRVQSDLADFFTSRRFTVGTFQNIASLGISYDTDGKLVFDQAKFDDQFNTDPDAVKKFLSTTGSGFADRLKSLLDQLAGSVDSLLANKVTAFDSTMQNNQDRIDTLTANLDSMKARLQKQFAMMEVAVAKIRSNNAALTSLASLAAQAQASSSA